MKKGMMGAAAAVLVLTTALAVQGTETEAAAIKGKLNKTKMTIAVGKSGTLKVKGAKKAKISFVSANKKIASVNKKGIVKGLKKGQAKIRAVVKNGKKKKKLTCKVTVIRGAKSLQILNAEGKSVKKVTLTKYESISLKAKITPKNSGDSVKWKAADTDIATVKNGVITGQYVGTTTVKAETISGKQQKVKVTVKAPVLTSSLKKAYENDFKIGAAVNTWQLIGNGSYQKAKPLITGQFNSITMENQMKPESLISADTKEVSDNTAVVINTDILDQVLGLAKDNGLQVRGHTLVWHSQTPEWFFHEGYKADKAYVSKETMRSRMENYIRQVLEYCQKNYPGIVYAWDVANEVVDDSGVMRKNSPWYKVYGDDSYVTDAFRFARKYADEGVSLFINDYNEYMPAKRDKLYEVAKKLYEEGICDGVGMQSHYSMTYPTTALVKVAIQKFNSIAPGKIQIQLTELDIHNTYNTASGQKSVAQKYGSLFEMLLDMRRNSGANITGVTFWGLTDADSWLTNFKRETSYPLLFGGDYAAKSAYFAVLNAASGEEKQ